MTKGIDSNSKRIAKNTILLYLRMIISTIVSLFTARLTLQLLGVEDFGIFNVVGSIIGFLGIITGTMVSATQRFLAYDLGKKDIDQYRKTFSMLINVFAIFTLVAIILMEFIGLYFIKNNLVIPEERLLAANYIYQFTILNFILGTMLIPYTSSIIAYERMGIYAYFTLLDVFFKLGTVYMLYIVPFDRLITYGALGVIFVAITNLINFIYCRNKLAGCKYVKYWNLDLLKKMASYAGWNLFGSLTSVLNQQGQAILLNMFFGPVINAAKAISDKIYQVVFSFCGNFFMAMNPQIIKSYASGDLDYTKKLVIKGSVFSFFLLAIISFPLILNMKNVLMLWLGSEVVTEEMVLFSQFMLINAFTNTIESPITQVVRATGKIKKYQIYVGCQTLLFIPITMLIFKGGAPAYSSMIILIIIYWVVQITRFVVLKSIIQITTKEYLHSVIYPIIKITVISVSLIVVVNNLYYFNSTINLIFKLATNIIIVFIVVVSFGMSKTERKFILDKIHFIKK